MDVETNNSNGLWGYMEEMEEKVFFVPDEAQRCQRCRARTPFFSQVVSLISHLITVVPFSSRKERSQPYPPFVFPVARPTFLITPALECIEVHNKRSLAALSHRKTKISIKNFITMSDSFMSSMTFATKEFRRDLDCDCDECGLIPEVPPSILASLRERKRRKLEECPIKRTQVRELVRRAPPSFGPSGSNIAIWQYTLPQGAEPLVEFGSSHRIVWIQRLPQGCNLRSIGTGIIGSSDEEKTRVDLDWQEGSIYFVPSNGGKAVGWIHHRDVIEDSSSETKMKTGGHAVLQIAKIPSGNVKDVKFEEDIHKAPPDWTSCLLQVCLRVIHKMEAAEAPPSNSKSESPPLFYKFNDDEITAIKDAFARSEENSKVLANTAVIAPEPKQLSKPANVGGILPIPKQQKEEPLNKSASKVTQSQQSS